MGYLFDTAIVLGRIVASKIEGARNALLVTVEVFGGASEDDEDAETDASEDEIPWGPLGYYCRPEPEVSESQASGAIESGAVEFAGLRMGDRILPLGGRDLRLSKQVNPALGATGFAQYGGAFIELGWNAERDGSRATIYVPRKDGSGAPVAASVISIDSGTEAINIVHENGASIAITADALTLTSPDGSAWFSVSNGEITMNAANLSLPGGANLGGSDPVSGQFVMLSTNLLAWIAEVNTFITNLNTKLVTTGLPVIGGGGGTAKAAAAVAPVPTAVPAAATKVKAI